MGSKVNTEKINSSFKTGFKGRQRNGQYLKENIRPRELLKIKMVDTRPCLHTLVEEDKLLILEKAGILKD